MQASEASAHGGQAARRYLLALHSLRRIDETTVEELLDAAAQALPCMHLQRSRSFTAGGRRRSRSGSGRGWRAKQGLYSAPTSPVAAAALAAPAMPRGSGAFAGAAEGSAHGGAGSFASAGTPPSHRSRSRGSGSDGRRSGSWSQRLLSALRSQSLPEAEGAAGGAAGTPAAGADSPAWEASSRHAIARAANAGSPQALRPLRPASVASGSGLLLSEYDVESRGDSRGMQPAAGSAGELAPPAIETQQQQEGGRGLGNYVRHISSTSQQQPSQG